MVYKFSDVREKQVLFLWDCSRTFSWKCESFDISIRLLTPYQLMFKFSCNFILFHRRVDSVYVGNNMINSNRALCMPK